MTKHVAKAWEIDTANRINGAEKLGAAGGRVNVHEVKSGLIYKDSNIAVTAFPARHGEMKDAFSYRFETIDRTSGI
jgi:hypothetical protein